MNILDVVFPRKCPICSKVLESKKEQICLSCQKILPRVTEPCCARCGKPIAAAEEQYCHDCEEKRRGRDVLKKGSALWVYDSHMKRAMANFKYEGCVEDAVFYVQQLVRFRGQEIMNWRVDAIIPVPLHRRKQWFRGYNQATVLAEELGRHLNLPVLTDMLTRTRYTKPQKGLAPKQRMNNVADAFALTDQGREKAASLSRVLLIDDIYTTGATLEACGEVLKKTGVGEIYFICLCIGRDY